MTGLWVQFLLFLLITGAALHQFGSIVYNRYRTIKLGTPPDDGSRWTLRLRDLSPRSSDSANCLRTSEAA